MTTYTLYIDSKKSKRSIAFSDFEITVDYRVSGRDTPATYSSPAEYPEVEIECFRIDPELASFLGISEVLDSNKVEEYLDISALGETLLQEWQELNDEPDY